MKNREGKDAQSSFKWGKLQSGKSIHICARRSEKRRLPCITFYLSNAAQCTIHASEGGSKLAKRKERERERVYTPRLRVNATQTVIGFIFLWRETRVVCCRARAITPVLALFEASARFLFVLGSYSVPPAAAADARRRRPPLRRGRWIDCYLSAS